MDNLKKFRDIAKKKWYIQGFNSCLNFISVGPTSSLIDCHNMLGYGYTEIFFIFKKDYLDFHYLERDFINVGNNFLERYNKKNSYLRELLKKDAVLVNDAKKVMKTIDKTNLKQLNKKELLKLYQKMWYVYHRLLGISHVQEAISFVVEPLLKEKLEKATKMERHDKEFRQIFTDLLQPSRPSWVNEIHIDLMKIIKEIKNKDDLEKTKLKKKIAAHRKKYFYNQINYFYGESLKDIDYVKEIKKLIKENIDVDEKLNIERERYKKNIKRRNELIKKFKLDKETVKLINLSVESLHWQDDRKKNLLSCVFYLNLLLKEISKRFRIPFEILKRYFGDEITYENLTNFDMKEGKERVKQYAVYFKKSGKGMDSEFYIKNDFKKLMQIYYKKLATQLDIHGMCASAGKVSGIVRICKTKQDIKKFKEGEVLVAAMTRPEYVPAMKKSVAIVTDEGGITSHAAIVARELGVPCIIGTKVATKVLKNGMLVEVNANHGAVKILK